MSLCPSTQQLQQLLAEQLAPADALVMEAHVETCASCQQTLERLLAGALPLAVAPGEEAIGQAPRPADPGKEFLRVLQQRRFDKTLSSTAVADKISRHDAAPSSAGLPVIAGYEILRVLGQGGMGIVYQAWQTKLTRIVALKMVLAGAHAGADNLSRFRTEVEASARLQHPNIVQVHEVGEQDGRPYLTLEFVEGGSLAEKLHGTPLPPRQGARLVQTLAGAMHYAHQRGILHRDLKPANILLTAVGCQAAATGQNQPTLAVPASTDAWPLTMVPKITDFGLAKLIIGGSDQTLSGTILGTPSYMAPEQAAGKTAEIGTAVDIYALGAILYELLSGRPPFRGATAVETLQQVLTEQPVPPRWLQPSLPADLETICLKCLETNPRQRYASAAELEADLQRFLGDEPIHARPAGVWKRTWKWTRRKPATASLAMVLVLSATTLLAGGWWYQARLEQSLVDVGFERDRATVAKMDAEHKGVQAQEARVDAEHKRVEAETQRDELEHNLYLANIPQAQRAWEAARVERVSELLASVAPRPGQPKDLRLFEWYYLRNLTNTSLLTLSGHAGPVTAVAFRYDGKQLASANADGTIKIWDARTGKELLLLQGHSKRVTAVAYSPDGKLLASGSADKSVRLWNAQSGHPLGVLEGHTGWVNHVAFGPNGKWLASASSDQTIKIWDTGSGRDVRTLKGHTDRVTAVALSNNNRLLASAGADLTVRLWDLEGAKEPRVLEAHVGRVYSVAFSPDGQTLASSSFDNTVRVWDTATGQERLKLLGHAGQIRCVAFSPDGQRLASAGFDQTVRLWDAVKGKQLFCLKGHIGHVNAVAFHPNGQQLASAGEDQTVKVWDATRAQEYRIAQQHDVGPVTGLAFAPDGRQLASGGGDRLVRVWDVAASRELLPFQGHTGKVYAVAFTSDGKHLASGGGDKMVCIWDTATRQQRWTLAGHGARVNAVAFSPDKKRLASAGFDGAVKVWNWNVPDGEALLTINAHAGKVMAVVYSPDGKTLASCGEDKMVRLWDAESGKELRALDGHTDWVHCVVFRPDGKWLASGSADGTIKIWETASGKERFDLRGHAGRVNAVVFSPDGQRLASAGFFDKAVKLWDLSHGQELLSLMHDGFASAVAFSPDGAHLASSGASPAVRLWDANRVGGKNW